MSPAHFPNWAGVWIDHFKAILVLAKGDDCEVCTIYSDGTAHHRNTGSKANTSHMHEAAPSSTPHHDGRLAHHRRHDFYEEVSEALEGITGLLVMGSGPAPKEFTAHFLEKPERRNVRVTTEKAEEMSVKELQRKVFEHFGYRYPRTWSPVPGHPVHEL